MPSNEIVDLVLVPAPTAPAHQPELAGGCCSSTAAPVPHNAVK
jgi:hypothetical protein